MGHNPGTRAQRKNPTFENTILKPVSEVAEFFQESSSMYLYDKKDRMAIHSLFRKPKFFESDISTQNFRKLLQSAKETIRNRVDFDGFPHGKIMFLIP